MYFRISEQLYPRGFPEAETVPVTDIFFRLVPDGSTRNS